MNKSAVYLAIFAVLCVLAGVIVGANITKNRGGADIRRKADFKGRPVREGSYEPRRLRDKKENNSVESLSDKLGLNQEQKDKISKIFENTSQDIENAGKDIRESIKSIKEKANREILDVLDSVQKEKFEQLQEDIRNKIEAQKARLQGSRQEVKSPPAQE